METEDLVISKSTRKFDAIVMVALAVLSSAFLLINLGNHYLWQDEAQTALISETVISRGIPYGTDGRNYFSQEFGAEYGENYSWKWHTWLPFYATAASFLLFGVDTFTARLPFALFGIGTILLTYPLTLRLWKDRKAALAAAIVMLLCIPFLLLARQCRYYSPSAFFTLLSFLAYGGIVERKRLSVPLFVASFFCLFQSHYLYAGTMCGAIVLHCAVFSRDRWKAGGIAIGMSLVVCMPWIIWMLGFRYFERYGERTADIAQIAGKAWELVRVLAVYVFPPYLVLIPLIVFIVNKVRRRSRNPLNRQQWSAMALLVFFVGFTWLGIAVAAPAAFFRYLAPIIPVLAMFAGMLIASAFRLHWAFGGVALGSILVIQPLVDYVYELTHDYNGPIEGMVTYLNDHADDNDIVAITYGDMPLKFYTNLRVVGGLTGEDLSPALDARWVIIRRTPAVSLKVREVQWYLFNQLDPRQFRVIDIDYPDVPFENRESPNEHRYRTATDVPPVRILERVEW